MCVSLIFGPLTASAKCYEDDEDVKTSSSFCLKWSDVKNICKSAMYCEIMYLMGRWVPELVQSLPIVVAITNTTPTPPTPPTPPAS